jgi:hypothetical protein
MKKQPEYSPEVIERAVRMVGEVASEYSSQRAAIESIAAKIGCTPAPLAWRCMPVRSKSRSADHLSTCQRARRSLYM